METELRNYRKMNSFTFSTGLIIYSCRWKKLKKQSCIAKTGHLAKTKLWANLCILVISSNSLQVTLSLDDYSNYYKFYFIWLSTVIFVLYF